MKTLTCRVTDAEIVPARGPADSGHVRITVQHREHASLALDLPLQEALRLLDWLREIELSMSLSSRSRDDDPTLVCAAREWA